MIVIPILSEFVLYYIVRDVVVVYYTVNLDDAGENGEVLNIDVPGINMAGHTWEITLLVSRNHKPKCSNRFLHNYTT